MVMFRQKVFALAYMKEELTYADLERCEGSRPDRNVTRHIAMYSNTMTQSLHPRKHIKWVLHEKLHIQQNSKSLIFTTKPKPPQT